MKVSKELMDKMPDLDNLVQQLQDEPEGALERAFPKEDRSPRPRAARPFGMAPAGLELPERELPDGMEDERRRVLAAGARAVTRLRSEGQDADLAPEELVGLEAIVVAFGRPALFVQNGRFQDPPSEWQILEQVRQEIEANFHSVGRVEVTGHPSFDWVGTGFLVARDVIMTNRHVAEVFCQMGYRRRWQFKSGMAAHVDYVEEWGVLDSAEFDLRSVIGIHEEFDMALFRVRRTSSTGDAPPEPLTVASEPPGNVAGRNVYAVGYPAWDGRRNDPDDMQRIFRNVFNVKRLQPGKITESRDQQGLFLHDCSTLGGNSGSCVVDLETNQVVGLHFGGRYMQANYGVALWQLRDDPLLKKAKVNFG